MSSAEKVIAPTILELINRTCELPTLPDVLVKLNEVMSDPESSAEDVAKVISLDPPVATNILRIVNSAYYGLQVRVSSVNLAVSIMGFNMTKKVALKAAVFSAFARKDGPQVRYFQPEAFWKHSIFCGVLARVLGQASTEFAVFHPEDLYICGLLHDIGKIILLESVPALFEKSLGLSAQQKRPITDVETETLGYTHADVGSVLAIKWFLPEELTIAIRYHHAPDKDPFHQSLSSLISVADSLAAHHGRPAVPAVPLVAPRIELLQRLGIEEDQLPELLEKANDDFQSSGMPW